MKTARLEKEARPAALKSGRPEEELPGPEEPTLEEPGAAPETAPEPEEP